MLLYPSFSSLRETFIIAIWNGVCVLLRALLLFGSAFFLVCASVTEAQIITKDKFFRLQIGLDSGSRCGRRDVLRWSSV